MYSNWKLGIIRSLGTLREQRMAIQRYWVYMLYCENNTLYTGYTNDLLKRYQSHVNGTGRCKYTRSFKPLYIAQCWEITGDKSLAMKVERYIKALPKKEKTQIIASPRTISKIYGIKTMPKRNLLRLGTSLDNSSR